MTQSRSFKSREAEQQFYKMLERYEAAHAPSGDSSLLGAARRTLDRHWLALRLVASVKMRTRHPPPAPALSDFGPGLRD